MDSKPKMDGGLDGVSNEARMVSELVFNPAEPSIQKRKVS